MNPHYPEPVIVLPGRFEGLLAFSVPVVKRVYFDFDGAAKPTYLRGVALQRLGDDAAGARWQCQYLDKRVGLDVSFPPDVDVRDPRGFDAAIRWFANRVGLAFDGLSAPRWIRVSGCTGAGWVLAGPDWCPPYVDIDYTADEYGIWFVPPDECDHEDAPEEDSGLVCASCERESDDVIVPELAKIDLDDPDADLRAFIAACLHVEDDWRPRKFPPGSVRPS